MRHHLLIALFVLSAAAMPLAAGATAPVTGLDDCARLQGTNAFGIYESVTPYEICTQPPLEMMRNPDSIPADQCAGKAEALQDGCRYFYGALSAYALTGQYLSQYGPTGEIDFLREEDASTVVYIDYLAAHLIMANNGNKAQAAGLAKVESFLAALANECTTSPSNECNGRLAQLRAAVDTIKGVQAAQVRFAQALIAAANAAANGGLPASQQISLLEAASTEAVQMTNTIRDSWDSIKTVLNNLQSTSAVGATPVNTISGIRGSSVISLPLPLSNISVAGVIGRLINALLGIVGALALLIFVWGGLSWMTAAGDSGKVDKAKKTLTWGALGLLAIFASYTILNLVIQAFR
jgi:hypothetical protein